MGLSRNKVAVSEGAAGSPPFYGESGKDLRKLTVFQVDFINDDWRTTLVLIRTCCSIFSDFARSTEDRETRGCSSAGRAPALQAGGHGFDSHHLHQKRRKLRPGDKDHLDCRSNNGL